MWLFRFLCTTVIAKWLQIGASIEANKFSLNKRLDGIWIYTKRITMNEAWLKWVRLRKLLLVSVVIDHLEGTSIFPCFIVHHFI